MRVAVCAALALLLTAAGAAAQPVVFLVRHAERADAGGAAPGMMKDDPDLSPAGRARAASLARLLQDARITAIFTTQYRRTRQTAAPLAKALGIQPTVIPADDAAGLLGKLRALSGNALVVGHSNTVPGTIRSLGVAEAVEIGESDFDNLFVVVRGSPPALVRLHYR
jgi:phosphohistidine phosphatase SixA